MADDILNESQAAGLLHQEERTLRLWRQRRGLPHFKPTHKTVLYRRSDLLAWLEKSRVSCLN